MKTKALLLIACFVLNINAITSYSLYKQYKQTDTLTHANLDSNLLRGSNWSAKVVDTLENKFMRFTDVKDSAFTKIDVDTVASDTITIAKGAKINNLVADSIKINLTGTMPCTLKTSDVTVQQIANAYWTKIGDVFTCSLPRIIGTSNSTTLRIYCKLPYNPKLSDALANMESGTCVCYNNGAYTMAYYIMPMPSFGVPYISIYIPGTTFVSSGLKGLIYPLTFKFIAEN